jgi:endonuclease/exonuclease/phosphatase family metal-dependent hydrolase
MLPHPIFSRHRFSPALLALACAFFLPLSATAVPVRIASFNICNASGADKLSAISNILQRVRPDILALEEATSGQEAAYTTLFASLGNPLPHHVFMPNPGSGRGTQGDKVAIYSRWPIVSSSIVKETDADPDAVEFMRWPLHAVIDVEGALNPLHVIALHAAASTVSTPRRIWRGLEMERVSSFIETHILGEDANATEYVVLGDFNDSADGRFGEDNASSFQPDSFSYETFRKYETNGTFASPFRLGTDAAWHSNNASRASHTMLYRTYPNERLGDMTPVTAYRTGVDGDWTTCLDGDVYRLDYILFSDEIAHSSYGMPEGEIYYSAKDSAYDLGLTKPGDFSAVDPAASTNASDHLLLFADFHMIDEIGGITPVAILSEVVHCATNPGASFVEICNTGADELDLDGYTLEVYLNGAAKYSYRKSFSDVVLDAGGTYWIAGNKANASNVWGRTPDATWTSLKSLDGDDAIVLRNPSGAIQDIYGATGVDGRQEAWNYADSAATRVSGVTDPISVWDENEWSLVPSAGATPGRHQALSEADVTLSTPQIHACGRASTAPTADEAFYFTVTATPNTLASNLSASALFRVDGGLWYTNAMHLADPDGLDWQSDAMDVARGGGSVVEYCVSVSFEGHGGLSPAGSPVFRYTFPGAASATNLADVLINEVKTSGAADFVELAGGAGVDVSGWSLRLYDTNAQALWSFEIPAGTTVPRDGVRDMWGNEVGFLVLAGGDGVANADLAVSGCTDGSGLFDDAAPRALVLANADGGIVDAVAWIATNAFESMVMDDELSTSVPRGAGNSLHCLGSPAPGPADSLQAPDDVRVGTTDESVYAMPDWTDAAATPGAPNVFQSDGALVLARVDRDSDGLLDDEDNCPTTPNTAQSDIDDDGIGDECDGDMDGDGIPNAIDNCPTEPNPMQEDYDADGIGNVCDPDYDEEESSGGYESLWVTFEGVAAGTSSAFADGGRTWRMDDAVVAADGADCKIGDKAMRAAPGAVLSLDGVLANRLKVVSFFFGPYAGDEGPTPDIAIELSADGTEWREHARVSTAGATGLSRAVVAIDDAPARARFRLRLCGTGTTPRLDIDDLLLVSVVQQVASVTLDATVTVAYDGAVHTNTFTVLPPSASWRADYVSDTGLETAAPVEIGTYTALVTVADAHDITGGTFEFPASLVILESLPDPEVLSCSATAGAVAAALRATVNPNRAGEHLLATFEFGTGTNFGSKVVADQSPVGGTGAMDVTTTLAGLAPNTRYHWRVNVGDVSGPEQSFATDAVSAPAVEAGNVASTSFALAWPEMLGATNYVIDIELGEATTTQWDEHFTGWPARGTSAGTTPTEVAGVGGTWSIVNASFYEESGSGIGSDNVVYLRNKNNNSWWSGSGVEGWLATPEWEGVSEISFVARRASGSGGNASGTLKLQQSADGGNTWTDLASYAVSRTAASNRYAFAGAQTNALKLRFFNNGSYAVYIHDVYATLTGGARSLAGFPAACATNNACTVTGLSPETTYNVLAKVEYPGAVASAWSGALAVTTTDRGIAPAFDPAGDETRRAAIGETVSVAYALVGDPAPVLSATSTAAGEWSATSEGLRYVPAAADVGIQTFTLVLSNGYGRVTKTVTVEVPAPPPVLSLASADAESLGFTWTPVAGAESYLLELSLSGDFTPAITRIAEAFEGNATNGSAITTSNGWVVTVSGANCGINTTSTTGMTGTGNRLRWTPASTATAEFAIPVPPNATVSIASIARWAANGVSGALSLSWGGSGETCTNPVTGFADAEGTGAWRTDTDLALGTVPGNMLHLAFAKTATTTACGIDDIVLAVADPVLALETAGTAAAMEGLEHETMYHARVSADGGKTWSEPVTAATRENAIVVPAPPVLSTHGETADGFTVSWDAVPDADSYDLEWSRDETFPESGETLHAGFEDGIPGGWTIGNVSGGSNPTVESKPDYAACGTTNVLRLTGKDRFVATPLATAPATLSFYYCVPTTGDWALEIQVAENADFSDAVAVDTLSVTDSVPIAVLYTKELGMYENVFVRLVDKRPDGTKYRYLDEITLTQGAGGKVFRWTTEETAHAVEGLGSGETWFVRAAAANAGATSVWSEVASATTVIPSSGLAVVLDPPQARWTLLGEEHAGGETVGDLVAGEYEISFVPLSGWDTPPPRTVALAAGETNVVTVSYVPSPAGLTVTLVPEEATWTFLGTSHASGETVGGLEAGEYEISFPLIDGYDTPAPVTVALAAGETNEFAFAYERSTQLPAPVVSTGGETTDGFTVSWDAVPDATSYDLEWSRFDSFAGKGEDLLADFESGAVPSGWSVGHTNHPASTTGSPVVRSNETCAACGTTNSLCFSDPVAGSYLATPLLPSPGELSYWYYVVNRNAWTLETQVASDPSFSDAVTVDVLAVTNPVTPAAQRTVDLSGFTNVYVRLIDKRTNFLASARYVDEVAVTAREGTEVFAATVAGPPHEITGLGDGEMWFVRAAAANASVTSAWSEGASTETVPYPAGITVTLTPSEAAWFLLGEEHASGETVGDLDAGEYEISFGAVHGFDTPAPLPVTLVAGETNEVSVAYETSPAGVSVMLSPAEATWFLLGEEHASGETVGDLDAGEYEIAFGAVHGWETPAPVTVTLAAGETNEMSVAFEASPAGLTVTLTPDRALWMLLGEDYESGQTVSGLAEGAYEISFSLVDGYDTPAPVTVALAAGETNEFAFAYERSTELSAPVVSTGGETTDGFTVSWDAVPDATSYDLEWSRFDSFAGKGEDLLADFESGAVPSGWSVGHTNHPASTTGSPVVRSNETCAACGTTNSLCFSDPVAGSYLATPLLPSPGELSYWYYVVNRNAWTLETQVASDPSFSDAVTVDVLTVTNPVTPAAQRTVDLSGFTNVYVRLIDKRTNFLASARYVDEVAVTAREGTDVFAATVAASPFAVTGLASNETWFVRAAAANASVTSAWSEVASAVTRSGSATDYEIWAEAHDVPDLWGTNALSGVAYAEEYLLWTNGLDALHAATADGAYAILVPTNEHGIAVDIEVADELPGGNAWRPWSDGDGELSPAGGNRYDVHPTNDSHSLFLRLRLVPSK